MDDKDTVKQTPTGCKYYSPGNGCMDGIICPNAWVKPYCLKDARAKGYCPDHDPKGREVTVG